MEIGRIFRGLYERFQLAQIENERFRRFQNEAHWKAGFIYWNPNDSAILVPKRIGIGYTFNFANKWSWMAVIAILAMVLVPFLFFHRR
jgi:uncharacterized membrane protein